MGLVLIVLALVLNCLNAQQSCTNDIVNSALAGLNANSLYCCGLPSGDSPCLTSNKHTCPGSQSIYGTCRENTTLSLNCSSGSYISAITFASYGTPTGTSSGFTLGWCHANTSISVLQKKCLSKSNCSVLAVNSVFTDPCEGTGKDLSVAAKCTASTSFGLGLQCKSNCNLNTSDIFRSSNSWTAAEGACLKNASICVDFFSSVQSALAKINPPCYLQQTPKAVSTKDIASYTSSQFMAFLQGWTGFSTTQSSSSSTTTIVLIVIVVLLAIIMAGILVFWFYRKRNALSRSKSSTTDEGSTISTVSEETLAALAIVNNSKRRASEAVFTSINMRELDMYYIPPNHLDTLSVIAQGAFGKVFLGNYLGKAVAIKTLLTERRDLKQLQKFIDEIALVAKLSSPHIVQFKGASWTTPADIMLVTEFMDGGDLRTVLEYNSEKSFTWAHKVSCALDIADALSYLHTLESKVIHRDLKSRNVLLNHQMQAKLTDFGVSKETDDNTMTTGIGTFRWMAPEVLLDNHYTESADMFSFGVILAELSTEIVPYSDLQNDSGQPYTDTAIMTLVMKGDILPTFSPDTPQWFYELGLKCLSSHPEDRPNAIEASHCIMQHL